MFTLLKIHLALGGYVSCGDNVEHELVVVVEQWHNLVFHIEIHAGFFQVRVIADVEGFMAVEVVILFKAGIVEQVGGVEVFLAVLVGEAYLAHLLVRLKQVAVFVEE